MIWYISMWQKSSVFVQTDFFITISSATRQDDGQSGSFLLLMEEKSQQNESDGPADTKTQAGERRKVSCYHTGNTPNW